MIGRAGLRFVAVAILSALVATSLGACSAASTNGQQVLGATEGGSRTTLTIFAAASLRDALAAASAAFRDANPGIAIQTTTGSSAALEAQIEQGAPADLFLSADTAHPLKLQKIGLAAAPVPFTANRLGLIVPAANPARISSPADLARAGVKVVAAGDAVPITVYANQLADNLSRTPGYPSDFRARYAANIVSREDDVAAVVARIELGEGDAGFVYQTDAVAAATHGALTIPVAESANVVADYDAAVLSTSPNVAASRAFLAWLAGPAGQAVLARFGFLGPSR